MSLEKELICVVLESSGTDNADLLTCYQTLFNVVTILLV